LQVAGESPVAVQLIALTNQPGTFEATFVPRKTGQHVLRVRIPGAAQEEGTLETSFQVELPSVETSQVWLNKPLLVDLAKLSGDGGRYFELGELDQLAAAVPDKTQIVETRSPPDPLWDDSRILAFVVVLLAIEWAVRKRNKLL
jgi:hypothetical protein